LSASGISIFLGVATSSFNTHFMDPKEYGDFKFVMTFFNFVIPWFAFGFFQSSSRLIALSDDDSDIRDFYGATIIITFITSILLVALLVLFIRFFYEGIYDNGLRSTLILVLPFALFIHFRAMLQNVLRGSNEIFKLSILRVVPRACYLLLTLIIVFYYDISTLSFLICYYLAGLLIVALIIKKMKPSFKNFFFNIRRLFAENLSFGFHAYTSFVLNTATGFITGLFLAYFVDNQQLGYFLLAKTITQPLSIIPVTSATVFFKKFATQVKIKTKVIFITAILSLLALLSFSLIIKTVFFIIFPH